MNKERQITVIKKWFIKRQRGSFFIYLLFYGEIRNRAKRRDIRLYY